MNAISPTVSNENGVTTAGTSRGNSDGIPTRALMFLKGAFIVSVAVYVTITWALQAAARFN